MTATAPLPHTHRLPPSLPVEAAEDLRRDCLEIACAVSALAGGPALVDRPLEDTSAPPAPFSEVGSPVARTVCPALTAVGRALAGLDAPRLGEFLSRSRLAAPGTTPYAKLRA